MSRASKVFYIQNTPTGNITTNINGQLIGGPAQEGDIAVVNGSVNTFTQSTSTHRDANEVYQYNKTGIDGNGAPILQWQLQRQSNYSDELVGNVTPIRKVHIGEIRNFINFIQNIYIRKYGDKYFNTHEMTNAVLYWDKKAEGQAARVYILKDASTNNNSWLHLEVEGQNASDRIRFAFRALGTANTIASIFDVAGNEIRSYVNAFFNMNVTISQNLTVSGNQSLTGTLTVTSATYLQNILDVTGNILAKSQLIVDGLTTLKNNLIVNGTLTVDTTSLFKGDATFQQKIIPSSGETGGIHWSANRNITSVPGEVAIMSTDTNGKIAFDVNNRKDVKIYVGQTEYNILTEADYGHGMGINADLLDGVHLQQILEAVMIEFIGGDYKDNGNDVVGQTMRFKASNGNWYYFPAAEGAAGTCHGNCHTNCHSNGRHCAKF